MGGDQAGRQISRRSLSRADLVSPRKPQRESFRSLSTLLRSAQFPLTPTLSVSRRHWLTATRLTFRSGDSPFSSSLGPERDRESTVLLRRPTCWNRLYRSRSLKGPRLYRHDQHFTATDPSAERPGGLQHAQRTTTFTRRVRRDSGSFGLVLALALCILSGCDFWLELASAAVTYANGSARAHQPWLDTASDCLAGTNCYSDTASNCVHITRLGVAPASSRDADAANPAAATDQCRSGVASLASV